MVISTEIVATVALALFGFLFGALWGHHGAIQNRVKYSDCARNRQSCPCVEDIKEIKTEIERI